MEKYPEIIYKHILFKAIDEKDLNNLLDCMGCKIKSYDKQNTVFAENEFISEFGILLSGSIHLYSYDFYGNRQIITNINIGDMFAESFCWANMPLPFEVIAAEKSNVLFLKYSKISSICSNACHYHTQLINNIMSIMAKKNINLTEKIRHVTANTVREKVLSYLNSISKQKKSKYFEIPFTRQELADYLSVDRSNLSNELGKLQKNGEIEFDRNIFKIK